ncbi:MAG: bifunctional methylenetetrahydrofolate dehydrogenase/methenyltetrahydrofolate cyclohydrolase [Gammaproteobacteria bacterium GWE2_42_36]|nr:MAG: bifunctional methylenetetrahydrofolate dehydrogenase/methenyltetrahydrofolate cyclohydrolase [Gammaproteobacteria bacterium GWE2_42_36]HCU05612.1 bifunctional methylenetetrahydrofolate dehydrogenase/methenyltetrahydrofolate cyclohydrolase FolD [Coxiellaceae bacterium]
MTAQLIDGKKIAQAIQQEIAGAVKAMTQQGKPAPGLAVILVGDNPASQIYVSNKQKACEQVGFHSKKIILSEETTEKTLLSVIDDLNQNPIIHGILVQLPLPAHINNQTVIEHIAPSKDVDGFHPYNLGRLAQGNPVLRPCTPYGCLKLIESTGITLRGKDAVIIGSSNIVGRPMALELLIAKCTVTICHRSTKNLIDRIKQAEILVVGAGQAEFIKGEWIQAGAVVIDVGINRMADGSLKGDVEFTIAKERASWITPVPGGVGPMTIAMLLSNTLQAAKMNGDC